MAALTEDDLKGLAAVGELRFGTLCAGRVHARVAAFLEVQGCTVTVRTSVRAHVRTRSLGRAGHPHPLRNVRYVRTYVGHRMESRIGSGQL